MTYTIITTVSQRPPILGQGFIRAFEFVEGPLTSKKEADVLDAAVSIYSPDATVDVTFTTVVGGVSSARTVRVQG